MCPLLVLQVYLERIEYSLAKHLHAIQQSDKHSVGLQLHRSDVVLINIALSQTSRAALKLAERQDGGRHSCDISNLDGQRLRISRLLENLQGFPHGTVQATRPPLGFSLASAALEAGASVDQSELVFDSTECPCPPFCSFELVASRGSCDRLAGARRPLKKLHLSDLNATTPAHYQREPAHTLRAQAEARSLSRESLSSNISSLRRSIEDFRIKGDNMVSMKIVAAVQHAFTCAFPIPVGPHGPTPCPWSLKHPSLQSLLDVLQNLYYISQSYLDASLRLIPQNSTNSSSEEDDDYDQAVEDLDGARFITFGVIVAVFDAVLRASTMDGRLLHLLHGCKACVFVICLVVLFPWQEY